MSIDVVDLWLGKVAKRHSRSLKTAKNYRYCLNRFCNHIECAPQKLVDNWKTAKYDLKQREQYVDDMLEKLDLFENYLDKKGLARGTIGLHLAAVQSFFKYMRIPVKVETFVGKPIYHNRDITREEIKLIVNRSSPRDRAFFLMMEQSGLRPGTLLQLTYRQIKRDFESRNHNSCLINVPSSMTKGEFSDYFSFIGPNAVHALEGYFADKGKPKDNERVFRDVKNMEVFSVRFAYHVRSLGLIPKENLKPGAKQPLRLYCLRKYFKKMAYGAGEQFVEFWMGHKGKGVTDHYISRDPEFHRKIYEDKAMPNLQVYEPSPIDLTLLLRKQAKQISDLEEQLEQLSFMRDPEKVKIMIETAKVFLEMWRDPEKRKILKQMIEV